METGFREDEQPSIIGVIGELNKRGINVSTERMYSDNFECFESFEREKEKCIITFDDNFLPWTLRNYINAVSESLQVCKDMVSLTVLSIVSLSIQGKWVINPLPGWIEPLNLYALIIARPSERKSPVMREITEVVYEYERIDNEKKQADIDAYELESNMLNRQIKNMIEAVSKGNSKTKYTMKDIKDKKEELSKLEPVHLTRLIADDITPEALISLMSENNERMAILSTEGGIFDIISGRYTNNNANVDVYLKAYSGDSIRIDRKGRNGEQLDHPLLTVLLMVQPSVIEEIMNNKDMKGRGLLARFLYVFPESLVGDRNYKVDSIPPEVKGKFNKLINDLLSAVDLGKPRILRLSKEADALAESYFNEIEKELKDMTGELEGWTGKLHGQTMRLAGILHCSEYGLDAVNHLISASTMQQAIGLGKYFYEYARSAFQTMGLLEPQSIKDAKYILGRLKKYIQETNKYEISKRDLYQKCRWKNWFEEPDSINNGLRELIEHGYIRMENGIKKKGAGRTPSDTIYVNPLCFQELENEYSSQNTQNSQNEDKVE